MTYPPPPPSLRATPVWNSQAKAAAAVAEHLTYAAMELFDAAALDDPEHIRLAARAIAFRLLEWCPPK